PLLRGLALAPLPALAAVIYLTSSRGGVATALFGTASFLVLTTRRWSALAAASIAAVGSIGAVAALQERHELVNEPGRALAESQGRGAALLIAGLCLLAGIVWAVGTALLDGRLPRSVVLDRAAAGLVVVAAVVGVAAVQPNQRFEEFKQPPGEIETESGDFVGAHLVSANGSGRWQLWESGVEEFETEPLRGRGAGSFEAWWAERGTIEGFVRDAHSLYVELLGELGIAGFLLLVAAFTTAIVAGLRRTVGAADQASRATRAALLAGFLAFALGAGIDWMWELTAVAVVGIALLGLLTGPATARPVSRESEPRRRWPLLALPAALALVGLLVVVAQAIPLVASMKIQDSQAAIARGDATAALDAALDAKSIQPWAASPYLQLALVEAELDDPRSAHRWIEDAIERDPGDWRLWVTRARIETSLGRVSAARRSIERARALNPRSTLFAGAG
ncbi:MAG: O-antigen ligase family protein, partial [Actinomycetota bacterium]|nr:O-antigen ligase family protein [Actinomycetota bacterium]